MPSLFVRVLNRFAYVRGLLERSGTLEAERARLEAETVRLGAEVERLTGELAGAKEEFARFREEAARYLTWVPPGHFLSPVPNLEEIRSRENEVFGKAPDQLPGVEIYVEEQIALIKDAKKHLADSPFGEERRPGMRFDPGNPLFSATDALLLYLMLRRLRPRRVVEIGSGPTTAAVLDVSEASFGRSIAVTVIESDPSALKTLTKKEDGEKLKVLSQPLHAVPLETFSSLTAGDVLLVTTSHVLKTGSDVASLLFRILPKLKSGVHVAVNGVFWPFEYPQGWVYEGRACNEAYALRAFLEFTSAFEIVVFGSYLEQVHRAALTKEIPAWGRTKAGGFWMKRL